MRISRFILSSLSLLACFAAKIVSDATSDESNNFNGLVLALKDLDYGSLPSFPTPPISFPHPPVNISSSGCTLTVSMIEQFRYPPDVVIC